VRSAHPGLEQTEEALAGLRVNVAPSVDTGRVVDPAVAIARPMERVASGQSALKTIEPGTVGDPLSAKLRSVLLKILSGA
jgi:hypothetical protein